MSKQRGNGDANDIENAEDKKTCPLLVEKISFFFLTPIATADACR